MKNFRIHPLFWLYMFAQTLLGNFFEILILVPSTVIHELGHGSVAGLTGYRMEELCVMPFGATLSLSDTPKGKNAVLIALAGPLTSGLIATVFVALWWIFPETYPYTFGICKVNLTLAFFNLLPAYPLDGGRIVHALIKNGDKAFRFAYYSGIAVGTVIFLLGLTSLFFSPNYSMILVGAMLPASSVSSSVSERYKTIAESVSLTKNNNHPIPVKIFKIGKNQKLSKLIRMINPDEEIVFITEDEKPIALSEKQLLELCLKNPPCSTIGNVTDNLVLAKRGIMNYTCDREL